MPIPSTRIDREYSKFVPSPTRPGEAAVEIFGSVSSASSQFSIPLNATVYTFAESTDGPLFTEVYAFYESGTPSAPVTLLKTITLFYSDSARQIEVGGSVS